ncbi:glycosyltransferase family 4 protein [Ammoniphilus sp. 3BR4]|uniref:glycosyltransferase family 4 protein n=1 Tax=Ammoniphilus sp. 3BR4 TaxID=3158265 RepID=UPI003464FDB4
MGGLGMYMKELKQGLENAGHQVDIFARNKSGDYGIYTRGQYVNKKQIKKDRKIMNEKLAFIEDPELDPYITTLQERIDILTAILKYIGADEYDLIHAQDIASAYAVQSLKFKQVPLVLTLHGCVTAEWLYLGRIKQGTPGFNFISSVESQVIQKSKHTIIPSKWQKNLFQLCNISTDKMSVIHNGLDVKSFLEEMKKKSDIKKPSSKKVILCTGRLEQVKGQQCLLEALAKLKEKRSDWECWIVGRGKNEKSLKKQCKQLKLRKGVKFLGRRQDVPSLLNESDIFVLPSLQENYPYSLMEAQVAGKAIIASNVGGITEMIQHGKNGLLSSPGDSEELYKKINKILKDQKLQSRLAKKAASWGREHLSLDKMTKQVLAIYETAIKGEER